MVDLVHDLIVDSATETPDAEALVHQGRRLSYADLATEVEKFAAGLIGLGIDRSERLAVYLEKRFEAVIALFGATAAGGVFVPINPLLKPEQVTYILSDCNVRVLVTSVERLKLLIDVLPQCHDLHAIIVVGSADERSTYTGLKVLTWGDVCASAELNKPYHCIDIDMAAILYTSGSTGKPKGVVLSHRNIVVGAKSVSQYLENQSNDRILSVLPLSFDYGLSQLTTAFLKGASVVLLEYLLPRDVINAVSKYKITGLAAVPPLWGQLADLEWPEAAKQSLRYFTNSGGAMPKAALEKLRQSLPNTSPYLMYGLTEAFRSTYLDPKELEQRPSSIGKAIPNAEILVINNRGEICKPNEEGELVHRGVHVAMGYWNAPNKTAERFKPVSHNERPGLQTELAVWSGDRVKKDDAGFLYFVGRNDEMIKSSGYRISPAEIEECLYQNSTVAEAIAFGVDDEKLGQRIRVVISPSVNNEKNNDELLKDIFKYCKKSLPNFMQPHEIEIVEKLPRNANGKIDRSLLKKMFLTV